MECKISSSNQSLDMTSTHVSETVVDSVVDNFSDFFNTALTSTTETYALDRVGVRISYAGHSLGQNSNRHGRRVLHNTQQNNMVTIRSLTKCLVQLQETDCAAHK